MMCWPIVAIYLLVGIGAASENLIARQSLLEFYEAAGGDHWINNTHWGSDVQCCEWYGVSCKGDQPTAL